MKKIFILSNDHSYTYNLRKEVIEKLLENEFEVTLVLPYGKKIDKLVEMGCEFIDVPLNGRGKNPFEDLQLLKNYYSIIKKNKPDAIISYTIKPNLYGGIISKILKIPFFPNITGLGTAIENKSIIQKLLIQFYKVIFKDASCVFFQNKDNLQVFLDNKIKMKNYRVIPGSGVNTKRFSILDYPNEENGINFVFISRIMTEKGIDQYLEAATQISNKYKNVFFHVVGKCDKEYEQIISDYNQQGIIHYHGVISDVRKILKDSHVTVHPTYYPEGLSNVLLESSSSGRPIITTNRVGTKEVIDDGVNGYIVAEKNSIDLINKIEKFLSLTNDEKRNMGLAGRNKVEKEFDRQIVVNAYLTEIKNILL